MATLLDGYFTNMLLRYLLAVGAFIVYAQIDFIYQLLISCSPIVLLPCISSLIIYEPRREKTGFLHMRKQRRRSASR